MTVRYGATPEEWAHWSLVLGLTADLLPVVCNPAGVISPKSTLKKIGKTPSRYNGDHQVVGIHEWTAFQSKDGNIVNWERNPDYGICLQTRLVRAIDIDVNDLTTASRIRTAIAQMLGVLPGRARAGTPRVALSLQLEGSDVVKRVIRLPGGDGIIEFLATGQQFVVAGHHIDSGTRYFWEGGLPAQLPAIDAGAFDACWAAIAREFGDEQSARDAQQFVDGIAAGRRGQAVGDRRDGPSDEPERESTPDQRDSPMGGRRGVGLRQPAGGAAPRSGTGGPAAGGARGVDVPAGHADHRDQRGSGEIPGNGEPAEGDVRDRTPAGRGVPARPPAGLGQPAGSGSGERGGGRDNAGVVDPVATWLEQRGWLTGESRDGRKLFVACPWEDQHTLDSGESSTCWLVAGTKGFELGHFECLHAHCAARTDADFLTAIGFEQSALGDFSDESMAATQAAAVPPKAHLDHAPRDAARPAADGGGHVQHQPAAVASAAPDDPTAAWYDLASGLSLTRSKKGWQPTAKNLTRALSTPGFWRRIALDTFRDALMWGEWSGDGGWRPWTNEDTTRARIALEAAGFEPMSKDMLRDALALVGRQQAFDSAQVWLAGLEWDGVPRVDRFMVDCLGAEDTPYMRAVSAYIWTALAGRVIQPGCKADMVPIFYSQQGTLKSTVIEAMAPLPEFYCTMDLADRDADLARRMRGRLVAELVELRGFFGREAEELKAFLSQKVDTWIPKFQEIAVTLPRRFIMFGSTNKNEVLVDDTGNRRFLPGRVGQGDAARIVADRDQLWAEGAARFVADGVAWELAELLAKDEHAAFMVYDEWQPQVAKWLASVRDDGPEEGSAGAIWGASEFTTRDVLVYACGLDSRQVGRSDSTRMSRILRMLGYESHVTKDADRNSQRVWRLVYSGQPALA